MKKKSEIVLTNEEKDDTCSICGEYVHERDRGRFFYIDKICPSCEMEDDEEGSHEF